MRRFAKGTQKASEALYKEKAIISDEMVDPTLTQGELNK